MVRRRALREHLQESGRRLAHPHPQLLPAMARRFRDRLGQHQAQLRPLPRHHLPRGPERPRRAQSRRLAVADPQGGAVPQQASGDRRADRAAKAMRFRTHGSNDFKGTGGWFVTETK